MRAFALRILIAAVSVSCVLACGQTPGADGGTGGGMATGGGTNAGGGANTGGGMGGTGGGAVTTDDAGCKVYATWPNDRIYGRYIDDLAERAVGSSRALLGDGGYSVFNVEYFYVYNTPLPAQVVYDGGVTYGDCAICTTAFGNCSDGGACTKFYLAQQGTVDVGRVGGRDGGGIFTATASGVKLVEWEYVQTASVFIDRAKDGGECIIVNTVAIDAGID